MIFLLILSANSIDCGIVYVCGIGVIDIILHIRAATRLGGGAYMRIPLFQVDEPCRVFARIEGYRLGFFDSVFNEADLVRARWDLQFAFVGRSD